MEALTALADPTRRRIVEMLAEGESSATDLGAAFTVSQPAISRHLRVLREAGLVNWRSEAQKRIYRLDPKPLEEVDAWLQRYRRYWSGRLDRLEEHLADSEQKEEM